MSPYFSKYEDQRRWENKAPYNKIISSETKLDNWESEGEWVNKELDSLSHSKMRDELQRAIGLKNCRSFDIYSARIPGSNCTLTFAKHYTRNTKGPWENDSETAYGVVLEDTVTYMSTWRVYSLHGAIARFEYWLNKLTNVPQKY
jgi:hypothetical protein